VVEAPPPSDTDTHTDTPSARLRAVTDAEQPNALLSNGTDQPNALLSNGAGTTRMRGVTTFERQSSMKPLPSPPSSPARSPSTSPRAPLFQ
jgi:hypothetical protein